MRIIKQRELPIPSLLIFESKIQKKRVFWILGSKFFGGIDPKLKKSFRGALNKTSMGGILGGILGNVRGVLGGSILDISIFFVI